MVAVISGSGLGIFGSSVAALGGIGGSGNASPGRGNDRVYVNTATGNLIVQSQDERLAALGLDLSLVRTYNSQGRFDDDNGDNWRLGIHQRLYNLTGFLNTPDSRITKVFGDGREVTYEYDEARNAYVSPEGEGAHDTLTFSGGTWTWKEGTTLVVETYDEDGRLTGTRDADDNRVTYTYTGSLLTRIDDASGQQTFLDYSGNNLVAIRVVSSGVTQTLTTYDYDGSNRLIEVTVDLSPTIANDALTYTTTYTYDGASHRIASISQTDGTSVQFAYQLIDGQYRVSTYTDGAGRVTTFNYSQPTGNTGGGGVPTNAVANGSALSTTRTTTHNLNSSALTQATGSWQAAAVLEDSNTGTNSPNIAFDKFGNGFAVWNQGSDVIARRYTASTASWSAPVTLDSSGNETFSPVLAVDRETGGAVVAWVQSDGVANSLYARRYDASTNSWSTVQLVESASGAVIGGLENLSVAMVNGEAAIAWMQNDGVAGSAYLSRLVNGSWTAPALLDQTNEAAGWPRVAVDNGGNVLVLWRQFSTSDGENRIHSRYWNDATQSLGAVQLLDNDGDRHPHVEFDGAGNAFAVWGGGSQVRRFDAATGQWSSQISLQYGDGGTWHADLSVDVDGNALVAWLESDGATISVYARRFDANTSSWGAATLIESLSGDASIDHYLSASMVGNEGVVAWIHNTPTTRDAYAVRLSGGVWGPATLLESRTSQVTEISASVDAFGNATVVWVQPDDSARSIYQARFAAPYYVVPSGATWQSVANTLYGVNSAAAGSALQAAVGGGSLSTGLFLNPPATLSVTTTVPAYYTVRAGDTWAHIASVVYGTADNNAIAALRSALGNPALTAGLELQVPADISFTTSGSYTTPLNFSATSTTQSTHYNLNPGAVTTPPATWSPAALLETSDAEASTPQVLFDAAGNGIAVWAQGTDIVMRRFIASTGTWTAAVVLDEGNHDARAPVLSVDRQTGNAVVAWVQSDGTAESLYARRYNFGSDTWSAIQLLENSDGAVDVWPLGASLSLLGEHAAIAWMQNDGTTQSVYFARLSNGAWTTPTLLETTDEAAMHPQVSVDGTGNVTVLWRQYSPADFEFRIHSVRWNESTQSFGSIQLLDADGDRYPRVAFDAAGNGFAIWGHGVQLRRFDAATGSWGPQILLSNGTEGYGGEISVDAAGNAIVAWAENDGTALSVYARRYDAATGTWSATALLETSDLEVFSEPRLAVSIVGTEAIVAWIQDDGSTGDVYAAKLSGGTWSAPTLLDSGIYWTNELTAAVSAAGEATVMWVQPDEAAPSIYQARLSRTPYYTVPAGATWQSIANALYGINSAAAGSALQTAMGSPALTTGLQLRFLPPTLTLTTTVPAYYVVQSGDTWTSITSRLYGTTNADAVAALQAQLGNPTLTAGLQLTVPTGLNYSSGSGGAASYRQTVVTSDGVTTRYEQDPQGRLVAVTVAPDTLALRTEYQYDDDGNVTAIIHDPSGLNRITRMTYDNGNLMNRRDDLGNVLERTYDADNQLLTETIYQVRDPDGAGGGTASSPLTTHYAYDGNHHLRFTVSSAGRVTEHRYYDDGQLQTTFTYTGALYAGGNFDTASLTSWAAAQDRTQMQRVDYAYDFRGNLSTLTSYDRTDSSGAGAGTPAITRFVYDQRGQLLQTIDARGSSAPNAGDITVPYSTTYTYDGLGRLLSLSRWNKYREDAPALSDVSTTFTAYDDPNRTTSVTLSNGLVTTTLYNLAGEVVSVVNGTSAAPSGLGTTTYSYDADGRLRFQTDPTGVRQFFEYDAAGRRVAQIDGDGTLTEFVYDDLDRVIKTVVYSTRVDVATLASLVGPTGQRTAVGLATIRAAADDTPADDRITRRVYDAAGLLIYEIDAEGGLTQYFYDGAGRVTDEVRYARPVSIAASVDEVLDGSFTITTSDLDRRTRHFYDADGLLRGTLDAMGYLVELVYDAAGRLVHQIGYANQTAGSLWAEGTLAQLRTSAGVDEETAVDPERDVHSYFFYDGRGQRIGVLDAEGYLTQTDHDVAGNVTQTIRYDRQLTYTPGTSTFTTLRTAAQGAPTRTMSYQYDGAGRVIQETNYEGTVTRYRYDSVGQLISTTRALGTNEARATATRYDFLGRVIQELSAEGRALITDSMDPADVEGIWNRYGIRYEYDLAGRRISATSRPDDLQTHVTRYFYDNDNRLRFEINQLGERKEYRYNALNQRVDEIHYTNRIATDGLSGGLLTEALITVLTGNTDPANDSHVRYTYSRTGQVASVRTAKTASDAEDGLVSYVYNAFGEMTFKYDRIDATRTLQHEYVYDNRGLLQTTLWDNVTGGFNISEARTYDAFGRLRTVTDARNVTSSFEYDRLGREIATVDGLNGRRLTTYDAFSRTLSTRDALGNWTNYSYNDATRTTTMTTSQGIVVTTVHNLHGQTLSVTAAGNTTTYTYDANGNLTNVEDLDGTRESRSYDRNGRQITQTDALGTVTRFNYDAANRVLTRIVDTGGLALQTTYVYDGQGRVTDVYEPSGRHTHTTYDRAGRVSEVAIDPQGQNLRTGYTYDRQDHVITVTEGAGSDNPRRTRYIYDTLGRRTEEIVDAIELGGTLNLRTQYRYDANDNLTRKIDARGYSTWYVYDANNRLVYTVDALGSVVRNFYDAEGRITETRRYATALNVDGFAEVDAPTAAQVARANSPMDAVSRSFYDGDGRERYTIDAAGTVTERVFDANGNVTRERVIASTQLTGTYADAAAVTNALGSAATTINSNDRVAWMAYDLRGRLAFQVDGFGGVTQYVRDDEGNIASKTQFAAPRATTDATDFASLDSWATAHAGDTRNRTTRFWYDTTHRLRFTLDAEGYLTETRYLDAAREEQTIVYAGKPALDGDETLEEVRQAASQAPQQADNQPTRRLFDAAGRLTQVIDAGGRSEYFGYDAVGNKTSYTNQKGAYAQDPAYTWNYEYDGAGRMIYERTPAVDFTVVREVNGALVVDPPVHQRLVTRLQYDELGNVRYRHEAYGTELERVTEYRYDEVGRQVRTTFPTVGVYDSSQGDSMLGNGGAVTRTETSGEIYTETWYDALGNAYRNRDVAGNFSFKVYDNLGRVTYEVDAGNYVTRHEYDRFGNQTVLTRYSNPLRVPLSPVGATVTESDITGPNGLNPSAADRVIVTSYDRLNRVESVTQPSVSNYEPGATAGSAGTTFQAGATTLTQYNAFGDVVRTRQLLTNAPTYADTYFYYDRLGQKVAEVDPVGYLTTYEYDETGDLTGKIEYARPRTGTLDTTTYGTIVTTTRHNAPNHEAGYDRATSYGYDRLNRKISETKIDVEFSTASGTSVSTTFGDQVTRFEYDPVGNQTVVIDHNAAATYTYYDVLGRAIAVAEPARNAGNDSTLIPYARMLRDAHGNLVQQINYGGGAVAIPTDGSLPTAAAAPGGTPNRITTLLLDAHGRAIRTRDASGAERFASYNLRGEVAKEWQVVTNAGNSSTSADDTSETLVTIYEYDALGRQKSVREPQRHTGGTVVVTSVVEYNAFGEIVKRGILDGSATAGQQEFFEYDQAGRVWRTNAGDGVVKVYLYNLAGQVTAELRSQVADLGLPGFTNAQQVVAQVAASDLMRTETRYDARGHVIERRLPSFGTSNGPEQVTTNIQVSGAPSGSGPLTLPLNHSVLDSADWYSTPGPNGGQWINSNRVSLTWPPIGDGQVRIVIYYRDKNPDGSVGSNEIYSVTRSGVSGGATIEWSDSSTSRQGGIYDVRDVYVYGPDGGLLRALNVQSVPPTPVYVHWTGTVGEYITKFEYRVQGSTGDFTPLGIIDLDGDQVGVNVGGLAQQTYEYRIRYIRIGDVTPYAESTGTFTLARVPGAPVDPAYEPGALNVTNTGGYIRWTAPSDTSVTARLRYRPSSSSTWVDPPLTATRTGGNFEVDARSALATEGSYVYEIEYTKGGVIVALTSGSLHSTGTIITRNTDAGPGGEYAHNVFNEPIATPNVQMGSNIGAVIRSQEHHEEDYPGGFGYLRWEGRNIVDLTWADLGSRPVTVSMRYYTAPYLQWVGGSDTSGGYWEPRPAYETLKQVTLANAGGGTTIDWETFDGAGGGGITSITEVVIRDANTGQILLTQGNPLGSYGDRIFWWNAPASNAEGPLTAVFGYRQGSGNYTEIAVDQGRVFSVRADSLPNGVSQYRIQYKLGDRVVAEQIGTLNIQPGSSANSTVATVQTNPPPGSTETVATITPSGGLAPASGSYGSSAFLQAVPDHNGGTMYWYWERQNVINVSFPNFSRPTRVFVDYTTNYNPEPFVPYANKQRVQDFPAGTSGGEVRWNDEQQAWSWYDLNTEYMAGGLSSVNRVRVYGQDASGNYTVLLADSAAPAGVPRLNWSAPSDSSLIPRFYYFHPTQGWVERSVTPGSTLSVDLSGIPVGSYQYKVSYFRPGESTERSYALGSFTTTGYMASNVTQSNTVNDPAWWSLSASGSTVSWNRQPTPGTTIEFIYFNGSAWVPLAPTSSDGVNYSVSFAGFPAGTFQYQLTYRVGQGAPYVSSSGTITTRIETTSIPPSMSIAPLSNTISAAAHITPITRSGDRLSWNYPPENAADRIEVRYWLSNSPGTVYTATASGSGSSWYADLLQVPANAGVQLVLWEVGYYRYRPDLGRHETNAYASASGYSNMTPTVTSTPATVTIDTQSTVYYHATATVTLDAPTLSTDPDTRHADALNTTVLIGNAHATATPDYGYSRTVIYDPDGGVQATAVEWNPLVGGYNRDGEAGPYSYSTGRYIYWSDPPEVVGELTPVFVYRLAGSSSWSSIPVEKVFSGDDRYLGANIAALGTGTYEYQIRYFRTGDSTPFAVRTGRVVNPTTATGVTDTTTNSIRSADVLAPRTLQQVDRWGNVTSMTDAADNITYYRFNQFDQMTERRLPTVEIVSVAANGAVTTSNGTPTSRQFYDILGRLIATQDENGNVNALTLNGAGQVIRETHADNTSRTATYDVFGNKTVEVNERGFRTEHTYDTRNLLTQSMQDAGATNDWRAENLITTSYRYDEAGRRISQTDGNQLTTYNWYDLLGNLTRTVSPLGRTTSYEYDLQGNKTRETDAIGSFKRWTYNYFGRLEDHHTLQDATTAATRYEYEYDLAGLLRFATSTAGQNLENIYDEAGHLIESRETGIPTITGMQKVLRFAKYEYDIMGRQVHATLHSAQRIEQDARMEYDAAGRLSSMWDRHAGTWISYDAAGNRTRIRSSASAVNNFSDVTYSPAPNTEVNQRLISRDWYTQEDAWDVASTDFWYAYDGMNRMTISRGTNASGTAVNGGVRLTYDAAGNKETRAQDDYIYTWGNNGSLNRSSTLATSTDRYIYDGANRLVDVIRDNITVEHYEYDKGSRQTLAATSTPERSNGGTYYLVTRQQVFGYNEDSQLTSTVTHRRSSEPGKTASVLESIVTYGVDAAGVVRDYSVSAYDAAGTSLQYRLDYDQDYILGESYLPTVLTMTRVQGSQGPRNNVTTRVYAQDFSLYSFSDQLESANNRHYILNAEGQIVASRQDLGPDQSRHFFVNGQNVGNLSLQRAPEPWDADRISGFAFNVDDGVVSGVNTQLPPTIIAQNGDTLRSVAQRLWGDANLWYLLAEANGLSDPDAAITEGTTLRVPNNIVSVRNSDGIFRPFDVNAAIGNTSPEQIIPAPPPPKKKGCGVLGQILLIVVAVVVTYLTAGATSGFFAGAFGATGGAIATGAVAAAAGSLASQGLAIATGMQEDFDWKGLASAALGGAIGGAFAKGIGIKGVPGEIAQGALSSALNQGVSIALGLQEKFNWNAVAAAAVAAPLASKAGKALAGKFNNSSFAEGAESFAKGLVNQAAYATFTGGKINYVQLGADAFGTALGNSIIDDIAPRSAAGSARSGLNLDADIEAGIAGTRAWNEAALLGMAAPTLDNNPRLIDPSRTLTPDQRVAQESSARRLAEAVQRIPNPPADLQTLEEVVVTAPRELNPYTENFLQSRGGFYHDSTRQRASQTPTYAPEIDRSLYVAPGFFKNAYDIAAAGFDDPSSTLVDKSVYFLGAVGTALPMVVEEAGRFILNAPDSASVGGQLLARGNLATDTDTKVESYLGAVSSFANAFNGFAALTPPSLMLPGSVPNLNAVPSVTMSAEELAAVSASYRAVPSEGTSVFHATTSPGAAQGVLNGIDPAFLNPQARFGRAFYIAENPATSLAELAHHRATPTTGIRFELNTERMRILDLTSPDVAKAYGYSGGPISSATQAIGQRAFSQGYNVIKYESLRSPGVNYAVLEDFNDILRPRFVSPTSP